MSGVPDLAAMQREFAAAVTAGGAEAFVARLAGEPGRALRRLAIYRRGIEATRCGALRAAHPVVARLVGDAFFDEAARRFALSTPPREADLNRYGAGFAAFLAGYAPAAPLPWLADVARLEWAWHESLLAADATPADFAALAGVAAEEQAALRFTLRPAVRLVRSAWPVLAIWEANQEDRDGVVDRDEGADDVLVWRDGARVRLALLGAPEAGFLEALVDGASLGEAADRAGSWDFAPALARLASLGLIAGFRVEAPRPG
jgi:hypothetical protein